MCILIDANQGHIFGSASPGVTAILDWIQSGGRVVAGGGKLREELDSTKLAALLAELARMGTVVTYSEETINAEITCVKKLKLRSDDPHVLAVARLSGAKVIVTNDNKLIADFKDKQICPGKRRAIRRRPGVREMSVPAIKALLNEAQCT